MTEREQDIQTSFLSLPVQPTIFLYNGDALSTPAPKFAKSTEIAFSILGILSGTVSTAAIDIFVGSPWQTYATTFTPTTTGDVTLSFLPNGVAAGGYIDDVQITTDALFTTGADIVNFNSLTASQQKAIAAGADTTNGLGGNDVVTLAGSQSFATGSKAGEVFIPSRAGGNYTITLGAGSDTVNIAGNGSSNIQAGSGVDTISINGNGNSTIAAGVGSGYDFDGVAMVITRLPAAPDQRTFRSLVLGRMWSTSVPERLR